MSNSTGLPVELRRECAFESRPGHHFKSTTYAHTASGCTSTVRTDC